MRSSLTPCPTGAASPGLPSASRSILCTIFARALISRKFFSQRMNSSVRVTVGMCSLYATSPLSSIPDSPLRQPLEIRHAFRDVMERLSVDGEDRHLRAAVKRGIVQRADLQDRGGQARPPCGDMGAAFGAEFPRHRAFKVAAGKLLRRALGVAEAVAWHQHEQVGRAAADVLAFAAMALRLQ